MVEIINCPNCNGKGCETCQYKGTVVRDESGRLYMNTIKNSFEGNKKNIMEFKIFAKIFAEPHDFFWAIKKKK